MNNNFQFSIFNFQKRGFTLVETMVAITILTFAISGAFFAANNAMVAANIAHDQLTASYLAQEGVEYVRLVRDNGYLAAHNAGGTDISTVAWSNFLEAITPCRTATCTLDPTLPMGSGSGFSIQACSL